MKQLEAALAAKDQELTAVRAQASETESKLKEKEDVSGGGRQGERKIGERQREGKREGEDG